jgi:DNA-binding winged helix-turn-helix (wHTH) protein
VEQYVRAFKKLHLLTKAKREVIKKLNLIQRILKGDMTTVMNLLGEKPELLAAMEETNRSKKLTHGALSNGV